MAGIGDYIYLKTGNPPFFKVFKSNINLFTGTMVLISRLICISPSILIWAPSLQQKTHHACFSAHQIIIQPAYTSNVMIESYELGNLLGSLFKSMTILYKTFKYCKTNPCVKRIRITIWTHEFLWAYLNFTTNLDSRPKKILPMQIPFTIDTMILCDLE